MSGHPIRKTLLIIFGVIVLFVVVIIAFISPIAKYLIEKYDVKYTGREITMDWLYLNPFTGNVHFNDLKIHEYKSDSVFFSVSGLTVNLEMGKLLSKTYEVSEVTINKPVVWVIQTKKHFNFDDMIAKFTDSTKVKDTVKKAPTHLNILNTRINGGEFHYVQKGTPVNYYIKKLNFESPGMRWDEDTVHTKYSFESGMGSGDVKGSFILNMKDLSYSSATVVNKFDLKLIEQYMKDMANLGHLSATLDANIKAKGNFKEAKNIDAKGSISINDFQLALDSGDNYASFKQLAVNIIRLSPSNKKFVFDSIMLSKPFFKYEKYDSLSNVEVMFGKKGSNVKKVKGDPEKFNLILEIADYVKQLSKNFFESYYKVNRLAIYNGNIEYKDYSLSEKFSVAIDPMNFIADSIDKNRKRVHADFTTGMKPHGNASIVISMNPKDEGDFDLTFRLKKLPIAMFNPYVITATSFPMDRGAIEMSADWNVRNGVIKSDNHLLVVDPRTSKKVKKKDNKWLPMPLIMSIVRERGNVIDYTIPITGNVKDPKFHFWDVITDLLKNILIKPPTTPYGFQVKDVENKVEKFLTLKWEMMQSDLTDDQKDFIDNLASFLKKSPETSVSVVPHDYAEKEKEYLLLFEAKKRYFLSQHKKKASDFSKDDSTEVEKMSIKDAPFIHYLNRHTKDSLVFTVQEKCSRLVGSKHINEKYTHLKKERVRKFMEVFQQNGTNGRVKMLPDKTGVPFNGFPIYEIRYEGELPKKLEKAYEQLEDLNDAPPREKYKDERKKNEGGFLGL